MRANDINLQDFERIKKKIYGDYAIEYNNVADIGRMLVADYIKGINSFEYMDKFNEVDVNYIKGILNELFVEKNMVMSVIKARENSL